MIRSRSNSGFTIIEIVVTLAVTSLFILLFSQMFITMETQRISVAQRSLASDIAYSNLRKFSIRTSLMTENSTCDPAKMDISSTNAEDKDGLLLGDETNTAMNSVYGFRPETADVTKKLAGPVKQKVLAYATHGCDGDNFKDFPILIVSKVSYGSSGEEVSHASYIK